jgi:hypothetical protein
MNVGRGGEGRGVKERIAKPRYAQNSDSAKLNPTSIRHPLSFHNFQPRATLLLQTNVHVLMHTYRGLITNELVRSNAFLFVNFNDQLLGAQFISISGFVLKFNHGFPIRVCICVQISTMQLKGIQEMKKRKRKNK